MPDARHFPELSACAPVSPGFGGAQSPTFTPELKENTMTDSTTSIALPVPAVNTAGVNVSTSTIFSTLLASLSGIALGFGGPILTLLQGTTAAHYVAAAATLAVGLGSTVGSVYHLVNANAAASSNTMAAINSLTATVAQALPALQAAAAPVPDSPLPLAAA
jgi:hypothetical protein